MDKQLFRQAMGKFFLGLVLMAVLLFLPAGTLAFGRAWLLLSILFLLMLFAGLILMKKNPELLRKRLQARETAPGQKQVIALSGLLFILAFLLAGLNFRFQWLVLPKWVTVLGTVVFLAAYLLYGEVLRENVYLSRTVEVQEGQRVIDTGLYGLVRHPMYGATLFLFLSMPLVLGSLPSFVLLLAYLPILGKRIRGEEALLERELAGYAEYEQRVKYRMIPFIW